MIWLRGGGVAIPTQGTLDEVMRRQAATDGTTMRRPSQSASTVMRRQAATDTNPMRRAY